MTEPERATEIEPSILLLCIESSTLTADPLALVRKAYGSDNRAGGRCFWGDQHSGSK